MVLPGPFHPSSQFYVHKIVQSIAYYPFNRRSLLRWSLFHCWYHNVCLLSFFLLVLQKFINVIDLFKEPGFGFINFLYCLFDFNFTDFYSVFFWLLFSYFMNFFRQMLSLVIWELLTSIWCDKFSSKPCFLVISKFYMMYIQTLFCLMFAWSFSKLYLLHSYIIISKWVYYTQQIVAYIILYLLWQLMSFN